MTAPSDEYQVGYARPPGKTRWKKGQSGNPKRRKQKLPESTVAVIDRLLLASVPITLNGETCKVPALVAIMFQLLQKAMAGNARAYRILQKYREFAIRNRKEKLELVFVESDYTRAFATKASDRNDG